MWEGCTERRTGLDSWKSDLAKVTSPVKAKDLLSLVVVHTFLGKKGGISQAWLLLDPTVDIII